MNKQISFSNVNFEFVKDYNSDEFALGRMAILSTAPNTHKIPFTDEDLLKYGETAKGKWVVCYFNGYDATDHNPNENIVGIIPKEQDLEFVRKEDGTLVMYAYVLISKVYASKIVDMFKRDNYRNVSVEITVNYTDETETEIKDFRILGVTILGRFVEPSCPDAEMTIINFSKIEEDFKKFKTIEYSNFIKFSRGEKTVANNIKDEDITMSKTPNDDSKVDEPNKEVDNKEDVKQVDKQENKQVEKMSEENGDKHIVKVEEKKEDIIIKENNATELTNTMSCVKNMADDEEMLQKCGLSDDVLEMGIMELSDYINGLLADNKALSDFKEEVVNKELSARVDAIMSIAKEELSDDGFNEVSEMSKTVTMEDVENFENVVKAKIYDDKVANNKKENLQDNEEVVQMCKVVNKFSKEVDNENEDVWTRIKKKVGNE